MNQSRPGSDSRRDRPPESAGCPTRPHDPRKGIGRNIADDSRLRVPIASTRSKARRFMTAAALLGFTSIGLRPCLNSDEDGEQPRVTTPAPALCPTTPRVEPTTPTFDCQR